MSKYTSELRFICESLAGWDNHEEMSKDPGYANVGDIIETARSKIFDFDYPIFDVNYKSTLESKIIKHFYFREIGAESYGQWKLWLERRLCEIMPYYNQLYESELLEFNPFYNSERAIERSSSDVHDKVSEVVKDGVMFTEGIGSVESESKTKGEVKTDNTVTDKDMTDRWSEYSDTPQGGLTGIADHRYLTNVTHDYAGDDSHTENVLDGKTDSESKTESGSLSKSKNKVQSSDTAGSKDVYTGNGKYLEYVLGKTGSETYSEMLVKYRQTFLNIDMMVIERLSDLFLNLW